MRTAARFSISSGDYWGARIRTWDRGTKTRCLTAWLRPIERRYRLYLGRSVKRKISAAIARSAITPIAIALHDRQRNRDAENEQLRGGEDPPCLAQRVRAVAARDVPPEADRDDRQCDCRPPVERVEEVEQALERSDPEREPEAALAKPAPAARRPVLDRVGSRTSRSTVPRRSRNPDLAEPLQSGLLRARPRSRRFEQAVHDRPGTADVRAERARGSEPRRASGERREVVRRQVRRGRAAANGGERFAQRSDALGVPGGTARASNAA